MRVYELTAVLQDLVHDGNGDKLVQLEVGHGDVIERKLLKSIDNFDNVTTLVLSSEVVQ